MESLAGEPLGASVFVAEDTPQHIEACKYNHQAFNTSCSVQSLSHVRLFATPWTAAPHGLPVHHQHAEFTQIHVHWVRDASDLL